MNREEYKKLFKEWSNRLVLEKDDDITLRHDSEKIAKSSNNEESIRKAKVILKTAIQVADPTGITNIPSFLDAVQEYRLNKTSENAATMVLEFVTVVPLVSYLAKSYKIAKAGKSLTNLNAAQRKIIKQFEPHSKIKNLDAIQDVREGISSLKTVKKEKPEEIVKLSKQIKANRSDFEEKAEILFLMDDVETLNTLNDVLDKTKEDLQFVYEFKEKTLTGAESLETEISLDSITQLHTLLSAENVSNEISPPVLFLSNKIIKKIKSFVGDEKIDGKDASYQILWQNEWKKPGTHSPKQIHKNVIEKIKMYMEKLSNEE